MKESIALAAIIFICLAIGLIGASFERNSWKNELIRRGHAEYNQQTGAWQWKEQGQ